MTERHRTAALRFDAEVISILGSLIVRLPEQSSKRLPSRGQVAVRGRIDGDAFQTVVEPDGEFGHWIRLDEERRQAPSPVAGDMVAVEIEPLPDWPEPDLPPDLHTALAAAPQKVQNVWSEITPMARWEWVRWVNATRNPDTRRRRVQATVSKLDGGKRRPCCFNLAACTDPDLSRNGRLIEPV